MILPPEEFMAKHRPNHWNESDDWLTELGEQLLDPTANKILVELVRHFSAGRPQTHLILVDADGVVDGHSRVLALWITKTPIWFEETSRLG